MSPILHLSIYTLMQPSPPTAEKGPLHLDGSTSLKLHLQGRGDVGHARGHSTCCTGGNGKGSSKRVIHNSLLHGCALLEVWLVFFGSGEGKDTHDTVARTSEEYVATRRGTEIAALILRSFVHSNAGEAHEVPQPERAIGRGRDGVVAIISHSHGGHSSLVSHQSGLWLREILHIPHLDGVVPGGCKDEVAVAHLAPAHCSDDHGVGMGVLGVK
mmetsp:Transcript_39902/g.102802  ORF Transcript_39902/g.102802 Transcript_39902/m.102802 type:complete len:214 (+) Transcript_39902:4239-4880(+)